MFPNEAKRSELDRFCGGFGIDIRAENQVVTVILIGIQSASLSEYERNDFRHVHVNIGSDMTCSHT